MIESKRQAVVIVGASNVSRGLSKLVEVLATRHASPLDMFVTAGHGRSYGVTSLLGVRSLPSILASGLWRDLDDQLGSNSYTGLSALITDVGNDLIYGFPPETVAQWVREIAERLAQRNARLAMVRLPLASVNRASEIRYLAIRAAFSPWLKLNFSQMKEAAKHLDASIQSIAKEFGAEVINQPGEWYGFDPIHIRLSRIHELWSTACDAWRLEQSVKPTRKLKISEIFSLYSKSAEKRTIAGVSFETQQPCFRCDWIDDNKIQIWLH